MSPSSASTCSRTVWRLPNPRATHHSQSHKIALDPFRPSSRLELGTRQPMHVHIALLC
jgi:hypothetical protein